MAKITITIETHDDNNVELVKAPLSMSECKADAPKKPRKRRVHFAVDDEVLLYKLSDAGLLNKAHGINFIGGKTIWFFAKDDDVKAVIDNYKATAANDAADEERS